ncbi:MAG: hypothetical protein GYA24_15375 [Candidatus Lokiarchaeota archaeon]|nr:hypothetical protein [Candidatus Lokiarchaeota archaeon]
MGRRKRKSVSYRPIRKAPTQFACPNCGQNTMKVEKLKRTEGSGYAIIKCSSCLLEEKYDAGPLTDPVDVYAMLVDAFYGEAGDKQSEQALAAAAETKQKDTGRETVSPAEAATASSAPAVAPNKVKIEEKASLADLVPEESGEDDEITEALLNKANDDDKDEVLDDIKKDKEKISFPDDDLDDDF